MAEKDGKIVLSMHPVIRGSRYHWDRSTWNKDLIREIREARAIILPQTVQPELYWLCRQLCPRVFPNYDIRFKWEGKVGDALFFWAHDVPHPKTTVYPRVEAMLGDEHADIGYPRPELPGFPFVLKANLGGEGSNTWLVEDEEKLQQLVQNLERLEWRGMSGFVIQEFITGLDRDLRVTVIGSQVISYWRINRGFYHNVARGGRIDADADPELQETGRLAVQELCARTNINLAAFDLIFSAGGKEPMFLEINYTFGRQGLGGSEEFFRLLQQEVDSWLAG